MSQQLERTVAWTQADHSVCRIFSFSTAIRNRQHRYYQLSQPYSSDREFGKNSFAQTREYLQRDAVRLCYGAIAVDCVTGSSRSRGVQETRKRHSSEHDAHDEHLTHGGLACCPFASSRPAACSWLACALAASPPPRPPSQRSTAANSERRATIQSHCKRSRFLFRDEYGHGRT